MLVVCYVDFNSSSPVVIIIIIDNRGLNARWCLTPFLLSLPTAAYLGQRGLTPAPVVVHVIPKGNVVGGVTSLGDDVFVVRSDTQQKIEVYDAKTFTAKRHITVPGNCSQIPWCYGLAACPSNKCLYASDYSNDRVHRVELSGTNAVMKWSVAGPPIGCLLYTSPSPRD